MWLGPAPYKLQQTPRARHVPRLLGLRRRRTHGYGTALHGPRAVPVGQGRHLAREDRGRRSAAASRRRGHLAQDRIHLRRRLSDRPRRRGLRKQGARSPTSKVPLGKGVSGFQCTIPDVMEKIARNARPRTAEHRFPGMRARPASSPSTSSRDTAAPRS